MQEAFKEKQISYFFQSPSVRTKLGGRGGFGENVAGRWRRERCIF